MVSYGQSPVGNDIKAPGIYLADGTKLDEFKKTFEIKDNPNPSATILSKIDVPKYWKYVNDTQRVEVLETETGLTLILYSRQEIEASLDFNTVLVVMPNESNGDENKKTP